MAASAFSHPSSNLLASEGTEYNRVTGNDQAKTVIERNSRALYAGRPLLSEHPPPTVQSGTANIILFGDAGVGKNSVINLIAQRPIANVSSDAIDHTVGHPMDFFRYGIPFDGINFAIFKTISLERPGLSANGYLKAIENAFKLIMKLEATGGIHLLLFCMRGGTLALTSKSNYQLFYEFLFDKKVPIALVFTGLEWEVEMEDWWTRNNSLIKHYGFHSQGHACITTVCDGTPEELAKYNKSQEKIRNLIKSCTLQRAASLPESSLWFARAAGRMMNLMVERSVPERRRLSQVLTQRCHMPQDEAERVMDMMEECELQPDVDVTIPSPQHHYEELCENVSSLLRMLATYEEDMSKTVINRTSNLKRNICEKLRYLATTAMNARQYDEAVAHYSTALSLNPESQDLYIGRSQAQMDKGSWNEALNDVDEAIARDPSSPLGYETKHAVLHRAKRYVEAVDAFEIMLLKIEQSPDPNVQKCREKYINPSSTRTKIREIVQRILRRLPRVVINTSTGRLQNRTELPSAFESLPIFNELISSATTRVHRRRIKREVTQYFRYVMLSHKWEKNEPLFHQVEGISVYDLAKSPTHEKLQKFCKIVREAGFSWAWSDTCCIDKRDPNIRQEALVAMFQWYRGSTMVIVYLRGVCSPAKIGDLAGSIWNTRAWTFQEYVAAKVILFYTEDWTLYRDLQIANHKESQEIISEMEEATRVSAQQLTMLRPGLNNIRGKLYLASNRESTEVEDAAYSLLGIFSVTGIPAIYGEGESALGRLLLHILSNSGDVSILAWIGRSSSVNSCLPASVTVYSQPVTSHLPLLINDVEMENTIATLRKPTLFLRPALSVSLAVRLYDRLEQLPIPHLAGNRITLPCIAFKLPPFSCSRGQTRSVYCAETSSLGKVEIQTRQNLTHLHSPCLVHPWLNDLLGREDVLVGTYIQGDVPEPSPLPDADDEDLDDEDDASSLHVPQVPLPPTPAANLPLDKATQALQLLARLRRPFGALLFTQTSMGGRVVYQRVAADSLITVQIQKNVGLRELIDSVCTLEVL